MLIYAVSASVIAKADTQRQPCFLHFQQTCFSASLASKTIIIFSCPYWHCVSINKRTEKKQQHGFISFTFISFILLWINCLFAKHFGYFQQNCHLCGVSFERTETHIHCDVSYGPFSYAGSIQGCTYIQDFWEKNIALQSQMWPTEQYY